MPTFRAGADAQQGPSRLKNLIHEAETHMAESGVKSNSILKILGPVRDLLTDTFFWQNQSDGLAVFSSPQIFKYYRVPVQFKELVVAASRFNIKPLFPLITDDGRFYVLTVSQKDIKLLQCTRYLYREISLPEGMPKSLAEAMKYEDLERQTQYHGHVRDTKYHGHIGTEAVGTTMISQGPTITQENKNRILRYFRDVYHGLHEILKSESVPVVFSGVDYLFPIYRQVNTYANLLDTFYPGNPDRLSPQAVHKAAWNQVSPVYHKNKDGAKAALRARRYLQQLPD